MADFLKDLLSPYLRAVSETKVPTSLADLSGFNLGTSSPVTSAVSGISNFAGPLASAMGVTLQPSALQSLIQAATQYGAPGYGELSMFGPGATYRTWQQQANLYAQKPGVAAPPGHSLHQQGLAVDLPGALQNQQFFNLLRALGWYQLEGEPWHWSYGVYG